ncbi:hypothetical protein [Candidatus Proelusimicrobium volucris]|uniref:hypothetical protein n=1 Tax=Candidatus Proelusimicrobium volucris TaxID=3416225 RepID=UPI003D0E459A
MDMLIKKVSMKMFFMVLCFLPASVLVYAESCSSVGKIEYKYTAKGCSYITEKRTCCANKTWSAWNGKCPIAPVSSLIVQHLECKGTSYIYESFGNGMFQDSYPPTFTIPYPKCSTSNICSGKSEGYICYQSYTAKEEQCARDVDCRYWSEAGTFDRSQECYWGGSADVTIKIVTCKSS